MKKPLITDEYPRNAVKYWILCNGGGSDIKVFVKHYVCEQVWRDSNVLSFNHVLDFNDGSVYEELCGATFCKESLIGDEE